MGRVKESENVAYATAYWFMSRLCPNIFPDDKAELAAETAIRYYANHKSKVEALSYIQVYRLHESKFWQSLGRGNEENKNKPGK